MREPNIRGRAGGSFLASLDSSEVPFLESGLSIQVKPNSTYASQTSCDQKVAGKCGSAHPSLSSAQDDNLAAHGESPFCVGRLFVSTIAFKPFAFNRG
jgi:hypothetical protein